MKTIFFINLTCNTSSSVKPGSICPLTCLSWELYEILSSTKVAFKLFISSCNVFISVSLYSNG